MKLLLVNGNITQTVTDLVRAEAFRHARPGTEITAVTATFGVPIVSTELENTIAGHAVLDLLATHAPGHDVAVLAISFDTALIAARQLLAIPVVGMTEASLHTACLIGRRFGLITFGALSRSLYVDLVRERGLQDRMAACLSIDVASVTAYLEPAAFDQLVCDAAQRLTAENGADVVVICGAAVAGIAARLQPRLDVPLLDGIGCAVRLAEMLVDLKPVKKKLGRRIAAGVAAAGLSEPLTHLLADRDDGSG
jgi:allantoin racemase